MRAAPEPLPREDKVARDLLYLRPRFPFSLARSLLRVSAENTETLTTSAAPWTPSSRSSRLPFFNRLDPKLRLVVLYVHAELRFLGWPRLVAIVILPPRHRPVVFVDSDHRKPPRASPTLRLDPW